MERNVKTEMNQNSNENAPRMVRVKCLKNFNLQGRQEMLLQGTEHEITAEQVEFLRKMGLHSGEFIQVIDPAFKATEPVRTEPIQPVTWTQTHGGKMDGSGVKAGLSEPVQVPPPVAPAPVEPETPGNEPDGKELESESAKPEGKKSLNLKKGSK